MPVVHRQCEDATSVPQNRRSGVYGWGNLLSGRAYSWGNPSVHRRYFDGLQSPISRILAELAESMLPAQVNSVCGPFSDHQVGNSGMTPATTAEAMGISPALPCKASLQPKQSHSPGGPPTPANAEKVHHLVVHMLASGASPELAWLQSILRNESASYIHNLLNILSSELGPSCAL